MDKLYDDEKHRDVFFRLDDDTVFGGHRLILYNSNVEWFKTVLGSAFGDATSSEIRIRDTPSEVFLIALKYAYGMTPFDGKFEFTKATVLPIFKAASLFVCHDLIVKLLKRGAEPKVPRALVIIDCGLQFGDEFVNLIAGFGLNILDINTYFLSEYGEQDGDDEEVSGSLIDRALEISSIGQSNITSYLNMPHIIEFMRPQTAEILLKKLNYVKAIKELSGTFALDLVRLSKRGFIPCHEIVHLMMYESPYVIDKFPLKVGHLVSAKDFKVRIPEDRGTLLFGLNILSSERKLDIKPNELPETKDWFYVFYHE